jgi:hypothetical protein
MWLQSSYATNEYETNKIAHTDKYANRIAKTSKVSAGNSKSFKVKLLILL